MFTNVGVTTIQSITEELPNDIHHLAIEFLRKNINQEVREEIYRLYFLNYGIHWIPPRFFNEVIDLLQEYIRCEKFLPSGRWATYVESLVDEAMGL